MPERKALLLRISPELWDDLSRWAAEDMRSVNGQIEWLLKRATEARYAKKPRPPGGATPPASTPRRR
jgi:hypothetical protein